MKLTRKFDGTLDICPPLSTKVCFGRIGLFGNHS